MGQAKQRKQEIEMLKIKIEAPKGGGFTIEYILMRQFNLFHSRRDWSGYAVPERLVVPIMNAMRQFYDQFDAKEQKYVQNLILTKKCDLEDELMAKYPSIDQAKFKSMDCMAEIEKLNQEEQYTLGLWDMLANPMILSNVKHLFQYTF